jgi:hypothetical protein
MSTIHNPRLSIAPDASRQQARVIVLCNVQFTQFEVNAMNQLGLRDTLRC